MERPAPKKPELQKLTLKIEPLAPKVAPRDDCGDGDCGVIAAVADV